MSCIQKLQYLNYSYDQSRTLRRKQASQIIIRFEQCSQFSEIDLENKQSPKIVKLKKMNSTIENNEQLHQVINRQIDLDEKKEESKMLENTK
ncbi:unnamed protein product [Paramecium octaurelia]|uniref:Uncharacterized protein n=1 Tax=Paramecium octaurelia TaxID=43137 RepID=A0A8S1VUL1_PAROT|nr:unnamed protein product [Paramecium octaurelia]